MVGRIDGDIMIRIPLTMRKSIRERMAEDYHRLPIRKNFQAVGAFWGITGGMAYRIIKDEKYWPKDKRILKTLRRKAEEFNL